jgi:L-alanine-DL-glutamate epimerase-like enolase superfamily enzyme
MKIEAITYSLENLQLSKPYQISYKTVDSVEAVILKLHLENGTIGLGASNLSRYVTGLTNDDTMFALKNGVLDFLIGKDIRCYRGLLALLYTKCYNDIGVRVMADMAIHDAATQWMGIPLIDHLGRFHDALPTSVTIGIMSIEETVKEAMQFLEQGFRNLKVKLGASLEEDLARMDALYNSVGQEPIVRIDANQGWSVENTQQFISQSRGWNLELIEQPVKVSEYKSLAQLSHEERKFIAADESLVDSRDALKLCYPDVLSGIFNIKLMKCGGIKEAESIADVASKHGLQLMWGCNDESIISISAALHAAYSQPNTAYIDLDGSFDLAKDVVEGGFEIKDGYMFTLDAPGLGVRLV